MLIYVNFDRLNVVLKYKLKCLSNLILQNYMLFFMNYHIKKYESIEDFFNIEIEFCMGLCHLGLNLIVKPLCLKFYTNKVSVDLHPFATPLVGRCMLQTQMTDYV